MVSTLGKAERTELSHDTDIKSEVAEGWSLGSR